MNCKMRISVMLTMLAVFTLTHAQEALPVLNLTLDKAIELALSDNPTMKIAEQEITLKEVLVEGLLSIQAGENPRVIEEKLKSFLAPNERNKYLEDVGGGEGANE